ncbi:hypothetical protein [Cryptosporangium aurantiacum]|uniref:hypothetical protein n=1 Tax=Cryptosporangium aurantiacum TaxID=134849 RepID=UPI000932F776|nr:hypothetical protein [Cryptosporangium aurantiacum]
MADRRGWEFVAEVPERICFAFGIGQERGAGGSDEVGVVPLQIGQALFKARELIVEVGGRLIGARDAREAVGSVGGLSVGRRGVLSVVQRVPPFIGGSVERSWIRAAVVAVMRCAFLGLSCWIDAVEGRV